ncbi:MAG: diacylglycerol O-acyltransferase, partial [Oceanicoccus sp.]
PRFVPGNIDHPVWVKDKNFELENHIISIDLPAPGTFEQLELKVAEIHAEIMDRNKPLWQLFVISGLEDNKIAFYNQAHHACIDGMSGQAATMIMMDTTPDHPVPVAPDLNDESQEGLGELFRLSIENFIKSQMDIPSNTLGAIDAAARFTELAMKPGNQINKVLRSAPKTRFNRAIGKKRTYAAGDLSVPELKAMGKAANCKLNDIFMAVCAGGLRTYLGRSNELPRRPLKAGCPVSLRKPGDTSMDNQVTMMTVGLATDIRDPLLRLRAIIDAASVGKKIVEATSAGYNPNVSMPGLPAMMTSVTKLAEFFNVVNFAPTPINLVISNVPGPRETLYSNGARMLTHYPVSIPTHSQGLNITASSYIDRLYFSVTACALAVPDPIRLKADIMTAFIELKSLLIPNPNKVTDFQAKQHDIVKPVTAAESIDIPEDLKKAS